MSPKAMAKDQAERDFNAAYKDRVKRLRKARFDSAEEMAKLLGIPDDRYKKYETRSMLPLYLVEKFAIAVGQDPLFVLFGKGTDQRRRA